jgi:3-deoxy-D-manno-octulosonic-acid transferase
MLRGVYNALLHLALPALPLRLWWRGRKEPGYRTNVVQRFGIYDGARPQGKLIWLHAVSLGETRAALPLLRALRERYPNHRFLVTQMTATGRAAASELYGEFAEIAWLPYDFPWAVQRFLRHFRPAVGIVMETELWPNLLSQCRRMGVPTLVVNARLSERSARGYARLGRFGRKVVCSVTTFGAQTDSDAARLQHLGARNVAVTGNLKFDVTPAAGHTERAVDFRALFGSRKVLLMASTREGEEAMILDALQRSSIGDDVLIVVVPRHPQRFDDVAALLQKRGLSFVRRSEARDVPKDCRFVLGDSMGEMVGYYAACDLTFIGGSLLPYGAQNLIEACAVGAPVLIGPSTFNFAQAAQWAIEAGAARRVANADVLMRAAGELLESPEALAGMREAGLRFTAMHRGATARTLALIEPLLGDALDSGSRFARPE